MIFLAVFLFPVAVYLLILGLLNRRPRPALVPGSWDCAGLLLACSGVLLIGGPALIAAFYSRDVKELLGGNARWGMVSFGDLLTIYWWIWLCYFVLVAAGCCLLIWWRSSMVSIYNIEPAVFDDTLAQTFDRLGLEWSRLGDRIFAAARAGLSPIESAPAWPTSDQFSAQALPPILDSGRPALTANVRRLNEEAVFDIAPFAATRHVSLIWRSSGGPLRAEIESALRRALTGVRAPYNPAGNWFLLIASALFLLIFLGVAVTFVIELQARRIR